MKNVQIVKTEEPIPPKEKLREGQTGRTTKTKSQRSQATKKYQGLSLEAKTASSSHLHSKHSIQSHHEK